MKRLLSFTALLVMMLLPLVAFAQNDLLIRNVDPVDPTPNAVSGGPSASDVALWLIGFLAFASLLFLVVSILHFFRTGKDQAIRKKTYRRRIIIAFISFIVFILSGWVIIFVEGSICCAVF